MEGGQTSRSGKRKNELLMGGIVAGWATPTVQDGKNCAGPSQWDRNSWPLNVQAAATGQMAFLSPAPMEKRGVLNPDLPRWLMGFPEEWGKYAPTEMR
jgi:hypothetical protein